MSAPRVAVVGAGAVGSYFAARAALAGAQVTLCLRRPRPGVVVRSGGEDLRPALGVVTDPADVPDVDWVFLAVKAHQTPDVANWLKALDRPGRAIVVMQNGVRLASRLDGLWSGPIVPAVVYCAVEMAEPGVVVHHSMGWFCVSQDGLSQRLADVFGAEQREVRLEPDLLRTSWEKLVGNVAGNSITALTVRRLDVMREPGIDDIALALMRECAAVGRAEGAALADDVADSVFARMLTLSDSGGSSMLYDRLRGSELEHEALVGATVSIGAEHGVPTPVSATILALLRAVSGRPLPA